MRGCVVTLRGYDGSAIRYDFSKTARTQTVVIHNKQMKTTLGSGTVTDMTAWPFVLIGGRMIVAAAEAWSWYRKTHPGSSYKRSELIQAILYAMLKDGTLGTPGGEIWVRLVPLVGGWVTHREPITPKSILDAIKGDAARVGAILAATKMPEEPYYDPSKDPGYDPYNPGRDPAP